MKKQLFFVMFLVVTCTSAFGVGHSSFGRVRVTNSSTEPMELTCTFDGSSIGEHCNMQLKKREECERLVVAPGASVDTWLPKSVVVLSYFDYAVPPRAEYGRFMMEKVLTLELKDRSQLEKFNDRCERDFDLYPEKKPSEPARRTAPDNDGCCALL